MTSEDFLPSVKNNFKRYIFILVLDAPLLLVPLLGVGVGDHD